MGYSNLHSHQPQKGVPAVYVAFTVTVADLAKDLSSSVWNWWLCSNRYKKALRTCAECFIWPYFPEFSSELAFISATSKISKNEFQGHIGKHLEPEEETFSKLKIGY